MKFANWELFYNSFQGYKREKKSVFGGSRVLIVQKNFASALFGGFHSMLWWSIGSFCFRFGKIGESSFFSSLFCLVAESTEM